MEFLRALGARVEASSIGELSKALELGFPPSDTTLTGPGKTMRDLVYAVEKGVRYVSVESLSEYRDLCAVCAARVSSTSALLRINDLARQERIPVPSERSEFDSFPSQLGMTAVRRLRRSAKLGVRRRLPGIHLYNGSQIFQEGQFVAAVAYWQIPCGKSHASARNRCA